MVGGGTPWHLRWRSLRGWHWHVIGVAAALLFLGFGFIGGWLLVRLPNSEQDGIMPTPGWLLWTGLLLCLAAFVMWAIAWFTAPLYDRDNPSDHLEPPMGLLAATVLLLGPLCLGLVVSAMVSSKSAYRGTPVFFAVMIVVAAVVLAVRSNRS